MTRPTVLTPAGGVGLHPGKPGRRASDALADRARPDVRQRWGKLLVVAGWITALVGVVVYCVATFAAESDADLAAILLHGAIPAARAGLFVVGAGTLVWIVGTVVHTGAMLDGAGEPGRHDDVG